MYHPDGSDGNSAGGVLVVGGTWCWISSGGRERQIFYTSTRSKSRFRLHIQQPSKMPASVTTTVVQITPFDYCKGCIERVKQTLRKHIGTGLIEMAPDSGKFTISTVVHPEVIKEDLQREFPTKTIILLPDEIVPPPPTTEPSAPPEVWVYGYPVGSYDPRYFGR